MIRYVKGDLLETDAEVIIHGCNAQGVMGSGVAKQIKAKWPEVYERYKESYRTRGLRLGAIIPVFLETNVVINAITQELYGKSGRFMDYEALYLALCKTEAFMALEGLKSIAMPKIGAGLGGGDWDIIELMVKKTLGDYDVRIYIL